MNIQLENVCFLATNKQEQHTFELAAKTDSKYHLTCSFLLPTLVGRFCHSHLGGEKARQKVQYFFFTVPVSPFLSSFSSNPGYCSLQHYALSNICVRLTF
jgi:hypothetical protein